MRIRKIFLYLLVFVSVLLSACGKTGEGKEISEWVEKGALVVDVRTPNEFSGEHYPGAVNIPIQSLAERLGELGPKDRKIVLYCKSGGRSSKAKSILDSEGFTEVKDAGGINDLFSAVSNK